MHALAVRYLPFYESLANAFIEKLKLLFNDKTITVDVFYISVVTFLSSFLLWIPANWACNKAMHIADKRNSDKLGKHAKVPFFLRKAVKDDDISYILISAAVRRKSVMATIDSQKVYVGYVQNTIDPSTDRKSFTLIPVMSGYRDSEQAITFTTDYSFVQEQIKNKTAPEYEHLDYDDFIVTIPIERLVSLRFFDERAYKEFNSEIDET